MKGKVLSLKIILSLLVALTASVCFAFGVVAKPIEKKIPYSTAVEIGEDGNKQEFSALFNNNVIFSVEKVGIDANNVAEGNKLKDKNADSSVKKFHGVDDGGNAVDYYFKDIQNGDKNKTVVDNGEFVMFKNIYEDGQYTFKTDGSLQEALMISFGSYIYDGQDKAVTIASNDPDPSNKGEQPTHSKISFLKVSMSHNGGEFKTLTYRNINTNTPYFDFTYLIKQTSDNSNEGHYVFNFEYMYNYATSHTASFEFYVINETSYTQTYVDNGVTYSAYPTLGWDNENNGFEQTNEENGYIRYSIGENGLSSTNVSYPTVTYDYIKYKLSYVHTANGRNTTHTFAIEKNLSLGATTATLVHTKTNIDGTVVKRKMLEDYNSTSSINLLTIMLTEPGTYKISYEYLYDGYNTSNAPKLDIETKDIKLSIHGLSLMYSKYNFEGAKMQYLEIANKQGNKVDLFIPYGHEVSSDLSEYYNENLGFVYKLVIDNSREGSVLTANSQNALINDKLKTTDSINTDTDPETNDYKHLVDKLSTIDSKNLENTDIVNEVDDVLENIKYAETNQGSLWLEGNDTYTDESFYFFNADKENILTKEVVDTNDSETTEDDTTSTILSWQKYTNTTSFKAKGYYLVFMQVKENGNGENTYWQVFAFRYTSSAVDVEVKTVDDEVLAAGKYTNKNVKISWVNPGVFDRSIQAYYYYVINNNYSREQMLTTTAYKFSNITTVENKSVATLGSEIAQGNYGTFLIRLEGEGEAVAHKMFVIDREEIKGVQAYLVEEIASGVYAYATKNDREVPILNSITDSMATISWNEKGSKANIYATYSYTPFSLNGAVINKDSLGRISTDYGLGTTIEGMDFKKAESKYSVMTDDNVLDLQGIYIMHLKDDAGNECYYAFIIDQTKNYMQINNAGFVTDKSVIYGDNVSYNIGSHKIFKLDTTSDKVSDQTKTFIQLAANKQLSTFENNKYYAGQDDNIDEISKYFEKAGNLYNFVVKNTGVIVYNNGKIEQVKNSTSGTLVYNSGSLEGASYYKRTLYITNESHTYSNVPTEKLSYVTVEINKDNSRGMVHYSDSAITAVPEEDTSAIHRLDTGSDGVDENQKPTNGLNGAHATSAKNLVFSWIMGSGVFEVTNVSYKFYELDPKTFNQEDDGKYYFYSNPQEFTIYTTGDTSKITIGSRAIYKFNDANECKAGLYVVTRTYKGAQNELGDDVKEKNYYFIVDRNGIITTNIGGSIAIKLMEGETEKGDFNSIFGAEEVTITSNKTTDVDIVDKTYNVYYETNKLPAEIKVPTGKYFNSPNSSAGYNAGKLNIQVFFNDINSQFEDGSRYRNRLTKIYDSNAVFNDKQYEIKEEKGFFVVDIYNYLSNVSENLRDRITVSKDNGTWLFLPGDYIVRITDNVEYKTTNNINVNHEVLIGFRITGFEDQGPKVDIFSDYTDKNMAEATIVNDGWNKNTKQFEYTATVSQEYLEVEIPKYIGKGELTAEVDDTYFVVGKYENGNYNPEYMNHPYSGQNINIKDSKYIKFNADGSFRIILDTMLKENGVINKDNFDKELYYTVKIRYKLNYESEDNERYKNCYIYYTTDGDKVPYYEAVYKINIDRQAPSKNIENLNLQDSLVADYVSDMGVTSMFENGLHETSTKLHFTKQYAKYYEAEKLNKGYIYVYQVNNDTYFDKTDVSKVYYKLITSSSEGKVNLSDLANYNLTLPFINTNDYTSAYDIGSANDTYGGILGNLTPNNYYEIIEQDTAGNVTQYVIHYIPTNAEIEIPVKLTLTDATIVEDAPFTFNTTNQFNIYNIQALGEVNAINDVFFKIELVKTNGDVVDKILTNATTDLSTLSSEIVAMFKQPGNYNLNIISKTVNTSIQINLYDKSLVTALNAENLVKQEGENYYIDLSGANEEQNENLVFATKVEIKVGEITYVYYGKLEENIVNYYLQTNEGETKVNNIINCSPNTTYKVTITDVLSNVSSHRFNTSGEEFYTLYFDGGDYYLYNSVHYGYTSANLKYSTIFTARYYEKVTGVWKEIENPALDIETSYKQFRIEAPDNGLTEVRIALYDGEILEKEYYITIDTRLGSVALRDYSSGELRDIISVYNNVDIDDENVKANTSGTGILNLHWEEPEENNYFKYTYTLFELLKDGTYRNGENGIDLTNKLNYVISTASDSKGIYKFVTSVWSKDDKYLGNRIYVFEVQEVSTELYYVRNEDGEAIKANSSFKISEFETQEIKNKLATIKTNSNIPLYISNQNLDVVLTDSNDVEMVTIEVIPGVFNVYKISKEYSFEVYLATLKIEESETIVDKIYVQQNEITEKTTVTIANNKLAGVDIQSEDLVYNSYKDLYSKNKVLVDIHHNNKYVKTVEFNNNLTLTGNGDYTLHFKDLAGNIHKFANGSKVLNVFILKELPVTINNQVVVDNAYYNEAVELQIYASTIYRTGSISIKATRNGEPYAFTGSNPYIFSDFGSYRVTVSAVYDNGTEDVKLTKTVTFSIINTKEATNAIDISNLKSYNITKVVNNKGDDITNNFKNMLNQKGMMVSYENVMEYADDLKVTSGKISFTVDYSVTDGLYAERNLSFTFTLNNELPKIDCSLKAGETTKKGFSIYFNPAIIFEQIGESYIYINDKIVAHITDSSTNAQQSIYTSYKSNGDGDYYVKLVSSSGRIVDSFKVTIKEPLNAWAIVIIVVAVLIVGTVTTVIIVLRRKMRIR